MQAIRVERWEALRLVGLMRAQNPTLDAADTASSLCVQWRDCLSRIGETPAMKLGIHRRMADGETRFDYFTGTPSQDSAPEGLSVLQLPALQCAVVSYRGTSAGLRSFVHTVFASYLPAAGLALLPDAAGAPEFIERYQAFDFMAGTGELEIAVPVQG